MDSKIVFFAGLALLGMFIWYFSTDTDKRKRIVGTFLAIFLAGFCVWAYQANGLKLGIDLKGGSSFLIEISPKEGEEAVSEGAREQARAVLEKRLNPDGKSDLLIAPQGEKYLILQMPGVKEEERKDVRTKITQVAKLELRMVHPQSDSLVGAVDRNERIEPGYIIREFRKTDEDGPERGKLLVTQIPDLTGESITSANAILAPKGWVILLNFDSAGAKTFGELSSANIGERMAIVMDDEVLSAPVFQGAILGGSCEISGSFTRESAVALASALENPLENALKIQDERSVDAEMGADTIKQGVYAGVAGLGITLVFMIIYYRIAGLVALIGLTINITVLFGAMALFGFTLTMPGIAGVILTIGIAIDANVLIYERLREELKAGKSLGAAIETAYDKAFTAIFDANATTLITAIILFSVASGLVKGFAITLTLGILASMFAALLVTRVCFGWATEVGAIKKLGMGNLIPNRQIDILGKRKFTAILSIAAIALAFGGLTMKGDRALGVDFKGGNLITLQTTAGEEIDTGGIKELLVGLPYEDEGTEKTIQEALVQSQESATKEGETYVTIRTEFGSGDAVETKLKAEYGADKFKISIDKVGPAIGDTLFYRSIAALLIGLLGILIYVTIRFEFSFALGALAALFHDIIITLGIVVLSGYELSLVLVGAFLTIAGYSINDTIVVFDRIRESLRSKRGNIRDVMNLAINATLGRTILTSLTTLIVVGTLFYFGGTSLKSFAFTLIVGVLVGTYSSLFVASPIVYWWARARKKNLRREVLDADQASATKTTPADYVESQS